MELKQIVKEVEDVLWRRSLERADHIILPIRIVKPLLEMASEVPDSIDDDHDDQDMYDLEEEVEELRDEVVRLQKENDKLWSENIRLTKKL